MAVSSAARYSLRPLAAYALLAIVALARRPIVRSRISYRHQARSAAASDQVQAEKPSVGRAVDSTWWSLVRDAASAWVAHKDARLGAALAYYSVFSIGPLIIIAVAIAGFLFGQEAVRGEVTNNLKSFLGDTGAQAINGMLAGASKPREGIIAIALGVGALLFAAIGVVVQLKDALNTVWEVQSLPGKGIWGFVRTYVLSLAGVLSLGFLLLTSMLATTALAAGSQYLPPLLPEAALQAVSFAVSFAVITLLFAMMYKWLPDTEIKWADVWIGAVGTAALFEVGKFLIGFYIGKQGLESTYGAAASIVVILIWVYYSAQIVLFGAEFTNVYAKQRGSLKTGRP